MHNHSVQCYYEELDKLSERALKIYNHIRINQGRTHTDRSVRDEMKYDDMNCVRPRITELIAEKWLEECGNIICPKTGKKVRTVKTVSPAERRARLNSNQGELFA